jgi:hypothetical protein
MAEPISIEQDYGRFVPPVVDKAVKEAHDQADLDFDDVVETEDGGAVVTIDEPESRETEFYENLAEYIPETVLQEMATDLIEIIEKDKEARKKRDEQYEEGIRRTGMGKDAPGGADFSGASKVVHPIMAEGCVDFASRAIKELFPPSGPVRTKIVGKSTREKLERADRKREYMNWQLTSQIRNYRSELEQLLTQLPLGGGQYLKFWHDDRLNRPDCEFVPIDQIYLPYACTNFYSSPRVTHAQDLTRFEFEKRVRTGLYRDIANITPPSMMPDETKSQTATDKVEGKESGAYNEDGLRRVYEIYITTDLADDEITGGDVAPYIITVDEDQNTVLSIYRNWEEEDITFEKLDWLVEWSFIPWRGAYPIGLPQLIGGLSAALTGALRALLDTAHINNSPSLLKLKGTGRGMNGQSRQVDPTEVSEIDGPAGVDDVRKIVMAMPFNPPSPVLFQLLDWLTNQAKGVVATAGEKIADATNSMPVGTALALIEQGSITYSAIHARLHHAQAKALEIIARLNRDYLDEEQVIEDLGELVIRRADFEGALDIIPVSDPNIFSEAQRYAQVQAILQLETVSPPDMFNKYAVRRRALSLMHVDDIDEILPPPPTPTEINAVAENVAITYGQPLAAFPAQDHLAHIETHLRFITDPNSGGNPMFSALAAPMMEHVKQHIIMYYAEAVGNAMKVGNRDMNAEPTGNAIRDQDNAIALASAMASEALGELFANFAPMFEQVVKTIQEQQKNQQDDIQDPAAKAMLRAALAETERKRESDANKLKAESTEGQAKLALETNKQQMEAKIKLDKQARDTEEKSVAAQQKMQELRLKVADATNKAANAQAMLDLKAQEQQIQMQLDMLEVERQRNELEVRMWEFEQEMLLKNRQLAVQATQKKEQPSNN